MGQDSGTSGHRAWIKAQIPARLCCFLFYNFPVRGKISIMGPWGMAGTGAQTFPISPFCHNYLLLYFSQGKLNHQWDRGAPEPCPWLDLPVSLREFFLIAQEVEDKGTRPPLRGNVGSVSGGAGKGDGNLISSEENTNPFMLKVSWFIPGRQSSPAPLIPVL